MSTGLRPCGQSGRTNDRIGAIARELRPAETALRRLALRVRIDAGRGPEAVRTVSKSEELARLPRDRQRLQRYSDERPMCGIKKTLRIMGF